MSALKMVGRTPDSDSSVVNKVWSDAENQSVLVDTTWINGRIAAAIASNVLQPASYVDTQDDLRAQKTEVDAADFAYVPLAALGVPGGLATLDESGNLTEAQVPEGVVTDRLARVYNLASYGTTFLAPSNSHQVNTSGIREYKIAAINVPDPGFPWFPLCFGLIGGYANVTATADRTAGSNRLGRVSVMPPAGVSDTVYAMAICTGVPQRLSYYPVLPVAGQNVTPATAPPIVGPLELDLWGSCVSQTPYVFTGLGLSFQVIAFPAVGG